MKKIFVILLSLLNYPAIAQDDQAIGIAYERYSVISGAWYLNQKCKFLSDDLSNEFTNNVDFVKNSLLLALKNPTMNNLMENGAKSVAESDKYANCGDDAKEIVLYSILASRDWSNTIRLATVLTPSKLVNHLNSTPKK